MACGCGMYVLYVHTIIGCGCGVVWVWAQYSLCAGSVCDWMGICDVLVRVAIAVIKQHI